MSLVAIEVGYHRSLDMKQSGQFFVRVHAIECATCANVAVYMRRMLSVQRNTRISSRTAVITACWRRARRHNWVVLLWECCRDDLSLVSGCPSVYEANT